MRVLLPDWPAVKISSPPRAWETPVRRSVSRRWGDQRASPVTRPCSDEPPKGEFDVEAILHRHLVSTELSRAQRDYSAAFCFPVQFPSAFLLASWPRPLIGGGGHNACPLPTREVVLKCRRVMRSAHNSALAAELVPCVILSVARHPGIFSGLIELSTAGILRPPRRTQNDRRWRFRLRMTNDPDDSRVLRGVQWHITGAIRPRLYPRGGNRG
jgi:hypothetical protein